MTAAPYDPTAVVGRRIAAWFIDLAIFLALVVVVLFASGKVDYRTETFGSNAEAVAACNAFDDGQQHQCAVAEDQVIFVTVTGDANGAFFLHLVAYIVIQGALGASIGKLVVGLRIVDAEGRRAGMLKSLIRTLLWVVDAVTCGLPIVGGVMIVSNQGHRRVGDLAAGTYVVDRRQVGHPLQVPATAAGWAGPPPGTAYGQPSWPSQPGWPAQPPAPTAEGPIWDDARDTYIQYDRPRSQWVEWDDREKRWKPIDT